MKIARSLSFLPVLAALFMASCADSRPDIRSNYRGNNYGSFGPYDNDSFGGHGGGYGGGYAIWPMPTDNYAVYGTFDDPYEWGGDSYSHRAAPARNYAPVMVSRQQTSGK